MRNVPLEFFGLHFIVFIGRRNEFGLAYNLGKGVVHTYTIYLARFVTVDDVFATVAGIIEEVALFTNKDRTVYRSITEIEHRAAVNVNERACRTIRNGYFNTERIKSSALRRIGHYELSVMIHDLRRPKASVSPMIFACVQA
jgi:hypothetical protein